MQKNHIENRKYEHRGVAPIIATLLMIAIAVVGGILIFVFAQGFFEDSSIQTPVIESIEVTGYDARDVTPQESHIGTDLIGPAANQRLDDLDHVIVYIRNKGAHQTQIDRVEMMGQMYTIDTTGTVSATNPAVSQFCILVGTSATCSSTGIVAAGQDASVVISFEDASTGDIKLGRPLNIKIITGGGTTITTQVIHGTAQLLQLVN